MTAPISTIVQTVADGLAVVLDSIAPELKAVTWSPRDLDSCPAAVIELPVIRRPDPDEEDLIGLGYMGLLLEYPVTFYFDLSEAVHAQTEAVAYVEAALLAIGFDPSLGVDGVVDSSLVTAEPTVVDDRTRPLIAYECQVHVLKAIPDPDP